MSKNSSSKNNTRLIAFVVIGFIIILLIVFSLFKGVKTQNTSQNLSEPSKSMISFESYKTMARSDRSDLYQKYAQELELISSLIDRKDAYKNPEFIKANLVVRGEDFKIKQSQQDYLKGVDCQQEAETQQCLKAKKYTNDYISIYTEIYSNQETIKNTGYTPAQRSKDQQLTPKNWSLDSIYNFKIPNKPVDLTY